MIAEAATARINLSLTMMMGRNGEERGKTTRLTLLRTTVTMSRRATDWNTSTNRTNASCARSIVPNLHSGHAALSQLNVPHG
jgi:hypothetical protein